MIIKLMMVGDLHVSDRAPSTRTESYTDDIMAKLNGIADMARVENVDAVVFVGDIFHSKIPKRTSHELVERVMVALEKMRQVIIVPGNHDYDKANPINIHKGPLGPVSMMSNVTLIGVPGQISIKVKGLEIAGFREEQDLYQFPAAPIVVAHAAIFPEGQKPEVWEAWEASEVAEAYLPLSSGHPKLIWYGHIHEPHGVYDVGTVNHDEGMAYTITFANLGAVSRGSMFEPDHDRTPQVGVVTWDVEVIDSRIVSDEATFEIEAYNILAARPAEEVFRLTEVTQERQDEADRSEFIDALRLAELAVVSVEAMVAGLRERSDVDGPVRERAVELIEAVT